MNDIADQLLGFYGGSFDPVHLGHIKPSTEAAKLIGLKHLTLLPCYISPLKDKTHSSPDHRVAMLKLAVKDHPQLSIDLREVNKNQPSYTVETLRELKRENPQHTLCFFMGMDSLKSFTKWVCWQEILQLAHLIVMNRGEFELHQLPLCEAIQSCITNDMRLLKAKSSGSIVVLDTIKLAISSSEIRMKIKRGEKTSGLLTEDVANYIAQHELYLE